MLQTLSLLLSVFNRIIVKTMPFMNENVIMQVISLLVGRCVKLEQDALWFWQKHYNPELFNRGSEEIYTGFVTFKDSVEAPIVLI